MCNALIKKITYVTSTSALNWSGGPKLQNGQYLGDWIVFYFVRGPKILLSLKTLVLVFSIKSTLCSIKSTLCSDKNTERFSHFQYKKHIENIYS